MNVLPIVQRHPSLRWLAPAFVVGAAGLAVTGVFQASAASESLPRTSPAALIAAVRSPEVSGFSGTVVAHMALGLPELPAIADSADGGGGASMASLLSGSHTLKVWYGGVDKQRIALLGATDETDLFHSGRDVWQWSSADRVALHTVLPAHPASPQRASTPAETLTPSGLATDALAGLDPSTEVTVREDRQVADRSAYELILTPRLSASTRVGSVHIAVDGDTKVPLAVQVFARGSESPSIDVGFTSVRFTRPSDINFRFTPPSNARVRTQGLDGLSLDEKGLDGKGPAELGPTGMRRLTVVGSGWSSIATYRAAKPITLSGVLRKATTKVSGTWGSGRLLESDLVSALITDDGRVYAGAVDPSALYAAAGAK